MSLAVRLTLGACLALLGREQSMPTELLGPARLGGSGAREELLKFAGPLALLGRLQDLPTELLRPELLGGFVTWEGPLKLLVCLAELPRDDVAFEPLTTLTVCTAL